MSSSKETAGKPARGPSRRKRLVFKLAIIVITIVFVEICCLLIVVFRYGSPAAIRDTRRLVALSTPESHAKDQTLPVVLHPYQGAILKPIPPEERDDTSQSPAVGDYGFIGVDSPIHTRSEQSVLVGIVGGSVAAQFTKEAGDILKRELAQIPRFQQRSITIIPLALGGYKQPQQLTTLSYLMTLGAEFDIVINIDGLNEAALPAIDNVPMGVFAAFPRQWGALIHMADSIEMKRRVGLITWLRLQDRREAGFFDQWPLRYCSTGLLVWRIRSDGRSRQIMEQQDAIRELAGSDTSYCASGPPQQFDDTNEIYDHCIDIWYRSSVLLNSLCSGHGARYFHFLQPNQYVAGSKPMSSKEESMTRRENSRFRRPVEYCYPVMRSRGRELTEDGVLFTDLTQVYSEVEEPIYSDDCCHVNVRGNEILADAVVDVIRQSFGDE